MTCEHGRPRTVTVRWRAAHWDDNQELLVVRLVETTGQVVLQGGGFLAIRTGRRRKVIVINRSAIVDIRDA